MRVSDLSIDVALADRAPSDLLRQVSFQTSQNSCDGALQLRHRSGEVIDVADQDEDSLQAYALSIDGLRRVGITDPEQRVDAFPHENSGGMKQRVMIAKALVLSPRLLIADDPTTALDVSIQAQILNLISRIRDKVVISMLFISHDLSVVRFISDRIIVLYMGRVMEVGVADDVFFDPAHPYSRSLVAAEPTLGKAR
ncbi:ATP-binding cassette domain-containing protein [Pseudooceanicola marinus]|uniref:ATP-binding cassette domain-containing protein n=1 Tax=Pseudooceanicola marinus TaxID=396013 RepID=UPI001CD5ECCE|nr:ATP-binding cassette domain-containing protein [Pseudooceanicola marinus]MCA1334536.1 ATP-binding cassette domain-containing protein [Pseudooceanicola marinus]